MAKDILEKNGIAAMVHADDSGGMRPALALTSGVDLRVQEHELKKAQELLKEL